MSILYIDDDSEDREFFKDAVHAIDPSFMCYTANDGSQGLKALEELIITPDFIFLDVNMPVMNGKEFLVEVKKLPRLRSIPVIMYSTTSHSAEMTEYFNLGAYRVLVKPASFVKVQELITSTVKNLQSMINF